MNDKIEGIILKINDYKDNDLMIYCLTKDKGILSLVAKSAKKINSKQHFYECSLYEFIIDYKYNRAIYGIHGSKLLKNYLDINDPKLFCFKNILAEITYKSKELYEEATFNNLNFIYNTINNDNKYLLGSLYVSYMLKIHGISPNVDECVICKNKKVVSISNYDGGFLCIMHKNNHPILDISTLKKFRLISKANFKDYDAIKDNKFTLNDFKIIIEFFIDNSSIKIKSYDFYMGNL